MFSKQPPINKTLLNAFYAIVIVWSIIYIAIMGYKFGHYLAMP